MKAAAEDPVDRPGGFVITDRALGCGGFSAGARLLDVGCGSGATVRHGRRRYGLELYGIDQDTERLGGQSHLLCARAQALPFPGASLEGLLMECSLSVLDEPALVLAECRRVLQPGGRLLVSDIYARGVPARFHGCLGRADSREMLVARVADSGFAMESFEDFSGHLRTLWGQRVFEMGSAAFCSSLGADPRALRAADCGYGLLIARKGPA